MKLRLINGTYAFWKVVEISASWIWMGEKARIYIDEIMIKKPGRTIVIERNFRGRKT